MEEEEVAGAAMVVVDVAAVGEGAAVVVVVGGDVEGVEGEGAVVAGVVDHWHLASKQQEVRGLGTCQNKYRRERGRLMRFGRDLSSNSSSRVCTSAGTWDVGCGSYVVVAQGRRGPQASCRINGTQGKTAASADSCSRIFDGKEESLEKCCRSCARAAVGRCRGCGCAACLVQENRTK